MDIRCKTFSGFLATQKDHCLYSDRYIVEVHDSSTKTSRTKCEHMIEWFRASETKEFESYFRENTNRSARRRYNSLMNAASLLWIAEVVGVDELTARHACEAVVSAGDYCLACGAIRKIVAWDINYALV